MKRPHLLFICLFIGFQIYGAGTLKAQTDVKSPKIIPLTPTAAEFSKYGTYKVSTVTGRPEINIPIYNIVSGSLKLPISLSYFAGGIKVSQLATWVGLGWSLNAGGIISRTVRGIPDETSTYGWIDDPTTASDLNSSVDMNLVRPYADLAKDPAPDFFSYNLPGKSGKFIYRKSSHTFETIPYNPIRIFRTPGSSDVNNNYQVTDENGVKYYFTQKQNYSDDNSLETPKALRFYTQSWYLTKIVSANSKDSIVLTYGISGSGGVLPNGNSVQPEWLTSRTYNKTYYRSGISKTPTFGVYVDQGITQSTTSISTTEPVLKEIIFKNGKVTLNAETGRLDYPGKLLDDLTVYALASDGAYNQVQKYVFNYDYFINKEAISQYNYRLKLKSINKVDINGSKGETHSFDYDETTLPSTQSTAQDYWGYYNGRDNEFLPKVPPVNPELSQWYAKTPLGSADRSANPSTIQAGMLQKITYPTGGYTTFNFDTNRYKSDVPDIFTISLADAKVTGIGKRKPTAINKDFMWPADAIINSSALTIVFSGHTNPGAADIAQQATLIDLTTGANIRSWEHKGDFTVPYTVNDGFIFDPSHTYRLRLLIDDNAPSNIYFNLTYQKKGITSQIKSGSGLRVNKITNYDKDNSLKETSSYTYIGKGGEGMGEVFRSDADFDANFYIRYDWAIDWSCELGACPCLLGTDTRIIYVGQGSLPQVTFEGSSVIYNQVSKIVSGPNGEINGKTIYNIDSPLPNQGSIYNPNAPGGKEYFDNNLIEEGKLPSEMYYSYDKVKQDYKPVGFISYNYSPFKTGIEEAVNVYRRYFYPSQCQGGGNVASITDFEHIKYSINLGTYKLTAVSEGTYNPDNSITEKSSKMSYDNPLHMQVTRTTTTKSDGKTASVLNTYADDYADGTTFVDDMKAANEIALPIEEVSYQGDSSAMNIIGGTITQYQTGGNGLVDKIHKLESAKVLSLTEFKFSNRAMGLLPYGAGVNAYLADNHYKERLTFNQYDNQGNLITITPKDGVPVSYQWGYNQVYPVVECKNTLSKNFFYQSFEETESNSNIRDAYTGNRSKTGGYSHSLVNLDNGNYVLRYWLKQGSTWVLQKLAVIVTSNAYDIAINSSYQIDDVAFYPADSQMATYTYDPLVGVKSQTDAKCQTTYYEYDEFQRLKNVKDQNGNIIKNNVYHYKD